MIGACSKDKIEGLSESESCAVSFALKADYTLDEVVLTRSAAVPAKNEFKVRIENTRAEILREWEYEHLPSLIKVVPGSYKLVGWYGSDTLLPAFEKPYYYGETKITLKEGDNLDTVIQVKVAATKVAIAFDESFSFDYDDYFVDVKTVGDSLRFLKEEAREGYFKPGKLRMRFGLKPKDSDTYYQFYPEAIATVKAGQFYKMTLKAQTTNGALSMISITTDSSTIDIPVNVELPPFYFPKKAPVVTFNADEMEEGNVLTTEGVSKNATAMITSAGGLTELKIKTVSDTLIARGWPAEFDLMKLTAEQKTLLRANGLDWSEVIDTRDTINTMVWVRFNDVIKLLNTAPGQTSVSAFEICAKDRFDQAGNECRFGVKVAPPVFEFVNAPGEGNVWAKRAIYDVKYISEVRTPVVECRGADGNWKPLETSLTETAENTYECIGKGLAAAMNYDFRLRMGRHVLEAGTYKTEEAKQVPNSDMEEWTERKGKTDHYSIWEVQGWCTMNELTTSEGGTNDFDLSPNRDGMAYCATSGTKRTSDCKTGTYAALVRSVGWGKGSSVGANNAGMKKATAGELYLGYYGNEGAIYGIEFLSRPAGVKFYSKYSPYNSSDRFIAIAQVFDSKGEIIAEGILGDAHTGATSEYIAQEIRLDYKNFSRRAAKMYIRFVSGSCVDKNKSDFKCTTSLSKDFEYVGAQLYIDDVELVYE